MVEAAGNVSNPRMSRVLHAALIFGLLVVIGWRVYGYFAAPETEVRTPGESLGTSDVQQWREAAGKAFAAEDWNVVVQACEKIVDDDPDNIQAWARLAYALHMLGRYDHAIAAYLRVCRAEGRPRQWAFYNIAAAYALKHEKDMALDYLREAVEAGYRQRVDERPVAEDPDFRALADDPEFQRLAELTKPVSQRNVYRQLDFIVGHWHLLSGDGRRKIGSAEFSSSSDGYAIVGKCADNARATESTIVAYYDPAAAHWKQVWLDDEGTVTELTSQTGDADSLVFDGESVLADGRRVTARVTWDDEPDGSVHLSRMTSSDGGNRWNELLEARLNPLRTK
jgi:tetratricopeptide (TPR) repeat protein